MSIEALISLSREKGPMSPTASFFGAIGGTMLAFFVIPRLYHLTANGPSARGTKHWPEAALAAAVIVPILPP